MQRIARKSIMVWESSALWFVSRILPFLSLQAILIVWDFTQARSATSFEEILENYHAFGFAMQSMCLLCDNMLHVTAMISTNMLTTCRLMLLKTLEPSNSVINFHAPCIDHIIDKVDTILIMCLLKNFKLMILLYITPFPTNQLRSVKSYSAQ